MVASLLGTIITLLALFSSKIIPGTIVLDTTEEFAKNIGNEEEAAEEELEVDEAMVVDKKTSEWKDVDLITAQFGEVYSYLFCGARAFKV